MFGPSPCTLSAVWWGVGLAATFSIIFGVIFICVYYKASENLFQGRNQQIFKASVSWIAMMMVRSGCLLLGDGAQG